MAKTKAEQTMTDEVSMYHGKRKFDREQLIFMCETVITAAIDRIESSMPVHIGMKDFKRLKKNGQLDHMIRSAEEVAGLSLAIFYAQLTGDGLGIGDAIDAVGMHEFVDEFVAKCESGWEAMTGEQYLPDARPLAVKFVDEYFMAYMKGI